MKFEDFTKPQQEAITASGKNIIVSAGAGSGKTAVLSERVLYFIKNKGYKITDFLIVTFTKLAAQEMKERIRKLLTDNNLEDANYVDVCQITTYDALALYFVKKYHNILNLSPEIKIIDSGIIEVKKRRYLDEILEDYYANNDLFKEYVKEYVFLDDSNIKSLILDLYKKASLTIDFNSYLENFSNNYFSDDFINNTIKELEEEFIIIKNEFVNSLQEIDSSNPKLEEFYSNLVDVLKEYVNATNYDELLNIPDDKYFELPRGFKTKYDGYTSAFKKLLEIKERYPKTKEDLKNLILSNKDFSELLCEIVYKLEVKVREFKDLKQSYEFHDIFLFAINLVNNHPHIKEEIKSQYKMIMIDEYQDTSLLQDTFSMAISNNNLYMVGDIKQSIYRFRDARCDLFYNKYLEYEKGEEGIAINMNTNFRSREELLDDFNKVFSKLMIVNNGNIDYIRNHLINSGNIFYPKYKDNNINYHTEFLLYKELKGVDKATIEAKAIAKDIINKINHKYKVVSKDGLKDVSYNDFCILLDRGSEFDKYLKVFNEYQIPLVEEQDENISENQIVRCLRNILIIVRCISNNDYNNPDLKHAYFAILRSFIYLYNDEMLYDIKDNNIYDEEIISKFRNIIYGSTLPIYNIVLNIIDEMDLYAKIARLKNVSLNETYLDTILNMFKEMSEFNYSIDEFLEFMDDVYKGIQAIKIENSGSDINSVRIMNIHKSKGLEFPIMYLAGVYKKFNRLDISKDYKISTKYGLIIPNKDLTPSPFISLDSKDELKEDSDEKIRLFYVALTRAKEKLIIVRGADDEEIDLAIEYSDTPKFYQRLNDNKENIILDYITGNISLNCLFNLSINNDFYIPLSIIDNDTEYNEFNYELLKEELNQIKDINISYLDDLDLINQVIDLVNNKTLEFEKAKLYLWSKGYYLNNTLDDSLFKNIDAYKSLKLTTLINKEGLKDRLLTLIQNALNVTSLDKEELDKCLSFIGYKSDSLYNIIIESKKNKKNDIYELYYKMKMNDISYNYLKVDDFIKYVYENIDLFNNNELSLLIDYDEIPYFKLLFDVIKRYLRFIEFGDNYNIQLILKIVNYFKLNINNNFIDFINSLNDTSDNQLYIEYKDKFFNMVDISETFDDDYNFFDMIVSDYYNDYIDKDTLIAICSLLDINIEFRDNYVSKLDKGNIFDSFRDMIDDYFNDINLDYDIYNDSQYIRKVDNHQNIKHEKLKVIDLNIEKENIEFRHASKSIDILASKKLLDFGTNIHKVMEYVDFYNPDLSNLDNMSKNIVNKFINSGIINLDLKPEIYKEYEFIDEKNYINGIIDLMVIYDDHIDIIDYKTKNINDDKYDMQLLIYKRFIEGLTDKRIDCYLYSLMDGTIKKITT